MDYCFIQQLFNLIGIRLYIYVAIGYLKDINNTIYIYINYVINIF